MIEDLKNSKIIKKISAGSESYKLAAWKSLQTKGIPRVVNTLWLSCLRQGITIPNGCTLMATSA